MIELTEGARRIDPDLDGNELGEFGDTLPSGQPGAVYRAMDDDYYNEVVLLGWKGDAQWAFDIDMIHYDSKYNYYYQAPGIHAPVDDIAAAERAEEEATILFNSIVKEIKMGKDPKKVAEGHGLDLTEVQDL